MKLRNPLELLTRPTNQAPVPYVGRGRAGVLNRGYLGGATAATPDALMAAHSTDGTLFPIVNALAEATSEGEWKLWRKAKSGKKEDRVEVTDHLALTIWRKPNDFFTEFLFVQTFQQHLDLTGEACWVVARDRRVRSIPLELWPVRPDRIIPVPSRENFIQGYVYVSPDGELVPLALDEVIRLIMPDPRDPYRGLGPVQSVLALIDAAKYSVEWNRNFFRNSALPGGIIQMDAKLEDEEWEEFQERWRDAHQGVSNAHRVAVLEQGAKWVDRAFSMRDMQFVELEQAGSEKIRRAFRFPKPMLGDVDDVNRANADAGELVFARRLIKGRLRRIKDVLNAFYLPLFGDTAKGLEFDFANPVPEDAEAENAERESKAVAAKTYVDAGFTGDSVKVALDLPEVLVWEKPSAPPARTAPATPGAILAQARSRLARTPRARRPRAAAAGDDQEDARADWELLLDGLLADWEEVSTAQREALAGQIAEIVEAGDPEQLADLTVPTDEAAAVLTAAMMAQAWVAQQRMSGLAAEAGEDVEPVDPAEEEGGPLAEALAAAALLLVLLLATSLVAIAARFAWWFWGPDDSGEDVASEVDGQLAALSKAELRRQLGWALWQAEGEARWEILERMDWDYLEAVEEDDRSTCKPCGTIDGKRFYTVEDAKKAYPTGGYVHCLGADRCRGGVKPRWEASGETAESS